LGRIFVLRIEDGEDLISSLQEFANGMNIESCLILFLGALLEGRAVTVPEQPVIPPIPHFESYGGGWEVFGTATLYSSAEGPKLHIHSSLGRGQKTITGCIRERAQVYLVVEAVLFEFSGLNARRVWDEKTGLSLLSLEKIWNPIKGKEAAEGI